jgi:hypothetical protein
LVTIKQTSSPHRSLLVLLLFIFPSLVAFGQSRILENGQPTLIGSESPLHPDSPTRTKIDLNGEWSYSSDESNWTPVKVPSAFDYEGQVTFVRKFVVDEETLSKRSVKLVALGINYEAEISVNDAFIGRHIGGSTSFEFEIPDNALRLGSENMIKVVVRNELNARTTVPLRKQIWGWRNYGGITRDIYLLCVPRTWIDELNVRTEVGKDLHQGLVRVVATITSGKSSHGANEDLQASRDSKSYLFHVELIDKGTNVLAGQSQSEPVTIGQNRVEEVQASFSVASVKLWSPDSPNLYRLVVRMAEGQGVGRKEVDIEQRTVGFTKISLENRSVVVNGTKTMLKGIVWHEDSPTNGSALTYEQMERDVTMMKSLGANAVRFEFHPPHPYMLALCSRFGLFALEEIPVWNAPATILAEEQFQALAEGVLREMIQRDRHEASLLAWGIGSDFDSSDPRARSYVERITSAVHTLDHRPAYFGSRMISNDLCSELLNFAALSVPPTDEKEFREILTQWKDKHKEMPVLVLRYFKPVEHKNRNGWSDPLSEEAQARFFESRYRVIKELNIAGSFVESFADWRGDRPIMTVHLGDPSTHPVGLTNYAREKRTAFDVVRSLYNEEKLTALPVGTYRASFPAAPLVFGLAVIFGVAYFINYNRRFADCFSRSLLRPYNFFADLRDLHAVASPHTLFLGVAIALTMAVMLVSFLYQFRTSMNVDFFLTQLVVSDWAKRQLIRATWNLFSGITAFTFVFAAGLVLVSSLIKLFSAVVRAKIFWYHAYSIAVWGALPLVFLIFPGMMLLKLLETPMYVKPTLLLIVVFLVWVLFRVLKGVSVIYDISPQKAYAGGLVFCLFCLGILGLYYDSAYALRSYLEFIVHISRSLG